MPFSKVHSFPKNLQKISTIAKLICHPARIQILKLLLVNGPTNVQTLLKIIPLSKPGISRHISELRKAGLLSMEEQNPFIFYEIEYDVLKDMTVHLNHFCQLMDIE